MSNDPEQIRREIERTRTELSDNVNALGDKVNPGSIAKRQVGRVRGAATSVKDAVMGSAADTASIAAANSKANCTVRRVLSERNERIGSIVHRHLRRRRA